MRIWAPWEAIDMVLNLGYLLVMSKVNIAVAKTNLSRYIEQVEKGAVVTICRRNKPVAELRGIAVQPREPPEIGWAVAR
jgi:prevent-host-death family protein